MISPRVPLVTIGYTEALSIILEQAKRLESEVCSVEQALGRLLSEAVLSATCLPPFDNAAMDGFALRVEECGAPAGTVFAVDGVQAAGDASLAAETYAMEVMTGACIPTGLNTVVPVEQVEVVERHDDGAVRRIRLHKAVPAHQHIRRTGEDVTSGISIMRAGEAVQPQHIMLLKSLGVLRIAVTRAPRVAVICTGRELIDDPSQPLQSGQIRNSNGPFIAARIAAAGAQCVYQETVGDEQEAFLAALESALQARADVVLSTGAVSMGRYDFIPDALHACGASVLFHKVRIRPGKPLLFARLAGSVLFFGLPGNPVAAAVGFRFFVEPALRATLGMAPEQPLQVPLATAFERRAPMTYYLKARLFANSSGRLHTALLPGQESFRMLPLLEANNWTVIPEEVSSCASGTCVEVYGLGHLQPPAIDFSVGEEAP